MDHLPTNHIKESVLEKIARKKVVMQPRRLFVFQWISITIVALIILVLGVLTLSFATYSIHESGELFLLGFGIRGVYTFFALFPWALIAGTFASIIIFLWLLRGSTLAYRIPILYLFGAFTLGCFLMGLMINSTPFHQLISELAEKNQHTFIQTWYERINLSDEAYGEFRGMVVSVDTDSFVVSYNDGDTDEDDTTHTVVPLEGVTIADVAVGDEVYIAGDIKNGVIHAYGFGILRPHTQ